MSQINDTTPANEATVTKQGFNFKSWYEKNKLKLSEARKQRYDTDPSYREKLKKQAKAYRAKIPPKPRKKSEKMTIPQLCEKANCSFHTFRKFQQNSWIPKTAKSTVFTGEHIKMLAALHSKSKETIYVRKGRLALLQPYIDIIAEKW